MTKNGLPKYCYWNRERNGERRVRFKRGGLSIYLTGVPWSESFMEQYRVALGNIPPKRKHVMHRPANDEDWEHWQIVRDYPGARWQRIKRTKCVGEIVQQPIPAGQKS
jgi:hypothetical protein